MYLTSVVVTNTQLLVVMIKSSQLVVQGIMDLEFYEKTVSWLEVIEVLKTENRKTNTTVGRKYSKEK